MLPVLRDYFPSWLNLTLRHPSVIRFNVALRPQGPYALLAGTGDIHLFFHTAPWFKHFFYSRQTKDTVNYCVLISKLLELMGDERIQL